MKIPPLKIGAVHIKIPTIMAPLAGITNLPFRLLVKEARCGLVCSEMISSPGLIYDSGRTRKMIQSHGDEKPLSVQLFGSKPDTMAEAAGMIEESGADILDINFGCSVKKVIKTGSGAALMKDRKIAESILSSVRKKINIPLTIKIRSGWDNTGRQALEIAKMAEDCGVDAIAVHPRTALQGFGGTAHWPLISEVKKALTIPVIGNGDVTSHHDALRMFQETGCDGVMIGRAAIGDPAIFLRIANSIENKAQEKPDILSHFNMMERYLNSSVAYLGEEIACKMMRSRLIWFVKGLPGCSDFRKSIIHIKTEKELLQLIRNFRDNLNTSIGSDSIKRCARFKEMWPDY